MKIALIGASGFVGTAVLNEALARGHEVTAIARHPERVQKNHPLLHVKKGDVFDANALSSLLKGHDAVVSTFNPGWDNPNIYPDSMKGSAAIQEAVKKSGVKRFLYVGGAGSLEIAPGVQLVDTPQFPAEYKSGALAARDYLDILKKENVLDWTFLSPAILMHHGILDGRTGEYRTGLDAPVFNDKKESRISVEDLALAIVDELEQGKFIRRRFTVGY
jgi:hypothetical protein